jgi:hypothetical protein
VEDFGCLSRAALVDEAAFGEVVEERAGVRRRHQDVYPGEAMAKVAGIVPPDEASHQTDDSPRILLLQGFE